LLSKVKKPTTNYFSGNKVVSIAKGFQKGIGAINTNFAFGHAVPIAGKHQTTYCFYWLILVNDPATEGTCSAQQQA
jgi:hypothetical protein